jgi:hypothetical protein
MKMERRTFLKSLFGTAAIPLVTKAANKTETEVVRQQVIRQLDRDMKREAEPMESVKWEGNPNNCVITIKHTDRTERKFQKI